MQDYVDNGSGVLVPSSDLVVGGVFTYQHFREGVLIDEWSDPNLVTNEGLNSLLGIMFHADTQLTSWYVGLFEGNYTPVATDTAANIASNATETTAYTGTTRPAYTVAAASGQSVTNAASTANFTFNATKTIYGGFVISDNTKSGTTGKLFCASRFTTSRAVVSGDQMLVTYALSAASA